jgi:magnesium-transporting ATPase (P-type)
MVVFLLLVLAAVALGIVGAVVKGLFYLLIIGAVVFVAALIGFGVRLRRRPPVR